MNKILNTSESLYWRNVIFQEGNTHEPVYGTEMKISRIETNSITKFQEAMENGHPSFHLPEKNTFIATKFDLKPREEKNRLECFSSNFQQDILFDFLNLLRWAFL